MEDYMRCLKRHPYILAKNPKMIFQLMANEAENESVVLEANVLGKKPQYCQDVWFQIVNKEQFQSPIVTKYHCTKKASYNLNTDQKANAQLQKRGLTSVCEDNCYLTSCYV